MVQCGAVLLHAAHTCVYKLAGDFPAALLAVGPQLGKLYFWILAIVRAYTGVDCCPFHRLPPFFSVGRPPSFAHRDSSLLECFWARAKPPKRAHAFRCAAVVFRARALPPSLPRAAAWAFFVATDYIISDLSLSRLY